MLDVKEEMMVVMVRVLVVVVAVEEVVVKEVGGIRKMKQSGAASVAGWDKFKAYVNNERASSTNGRM